VSNRALRAIRLFFPLFVFSVLACGVLDVGIERTPVPDYAATQTLTALVAQNSALTARISALATPTLRELGKIAYVSNGNIWIKNLPADTAWPLTSAGQNREPKWAASGNWLAYRSDRQVWIAAADGTNAHAINSGKPIQNFAWALRTILPDRLAYATDSGILRTESADGSSVVTLVTQTSTQNQIAQIQHIAWAPGGVWLAYDLSISDNNRQPIYQGLWKVSTKTGERVELFSSNMPDRNDVVLSGWSLSGQSVLFWQGVALPAGGLPFYAISAESDLPERESLQLSLKPVLVNSDAAAPLPPTTETRDDLLALVTTATDPAGLPMTRLEVANKPISAEDSSAMFPAWSPNGKRLAYIAVTTSKDNNNLGQRHLIVTDASGDGETRQLTDDPIYRDDRPQWSATGNYILFARLDRVGQASLWLMNPEGTSPIKVESVSADADLSGDVQWELVWDWWRGATEAPAARPAVPENPPFIVTDLPHSLRSKTFTFSEFGLSMNLPADWESTRYPDAILAGSPPLNLQSWNLTLSAETELPANLSMLTRILTQHWQDEGLGNISRASIIVGQNGQQFPGILFIGMPDSCAEVYVPIRGQTYRFALRPPLCDNSRGQAHLTPLGQSLLASVSSTSRNNSSQ